MRIICVPISSLECRYPLQTTVNRCSRSLRLDCVSSLCDSPLTAMKLALYSTLFNCLLLSNLNCDVQLLVVQPDPYKFLQHASDPIMPALEHFFDDDEEEVQSSEEDTSSESSEAGESSDFREEVDAVDKKPLIDCDCKETLSPDMRSFVVVDGRCPHWANSPYQPPSELLHLMNELEKEGDEVSGTPLIAYVRDGF
jgi:hypothetical protein